ncbi:hypothetical protein [Enterococcus sp. AZ012]|uniref:hypothetical protein n=1 Tax=Enterococcus sp. AZ012 TaxID=2774682 RepID=UPI003D29103C
MSYKRDLDKALTVEDCQVAYEKECKSRLERYSKSDPENAVSRLICEDFVLWGAAEKRAVQIKGYEMHFDSFVESKY